MTLLLVNGTFAPRAVWAQESSRLVKKLRSSFGVELQVRRFHWSGDNSHRARVKAGGKLGRFILRLRSEIAVGPIFIIGHSHGGNVAGYALRDKQAAESVSGVVFMATPFIEIERRDLSAAVKLLGWTLPLLIAPAFCITLFWLLFFAANYEDSALEIWARDKSVMVESLCSAVPMGLLLIGAPTVGWILIKVAKHLGGPFRERILSLFSNYQFRRVNELAWVANDLLPTLVLRIRGDEAGIGLQCLFFLSESLPRLWRLARVITFCMVALVVVLWGATGTFLRDCASLASHIPFSGYLKNNPDDFQLWTLILLFLWIVFLIVLQVGMATTPLIIRAHRFGFGGENVLDNWLLRIRAVVRPPHSSFCEFHEFSLGSLGEQLSWRFKHTLRHSVYEQDEAIALITEWLRKHGRGNS